MPLKPSINVGAIQVGVGPRGAKRWRHASGQWQYGEPPTGVPGEPCGKGQCEAAGWHQDRHLIWAPDGKRKVCDDCYDEAEYEISR